MTMYIYTHTYILVYCTVAPQLFFSGPLSGASYKQNVKKGYISINGLYVLCLIMLSENVHNYVDLASNC